MFEWNVWRLCQIPRKIFVPLLISIDQIFNSRWLHKCHLWYLRHPAQLINFRDLIKRAVKIQLPLLKFILKFISNTIRSILHS